MRCWFMMEINFHDTGILFFIHFTSRLLWITQQKVIKSTINFYIIIYLFIFLNQWYPSYMVNYSLLIYLQGRPLLDVCGNDFCQKDGSQSHILFFLTLF